MKNLVSLFHKHNNQQNIAMNIFRTPINWMEHPIDEKESAYIEVHCLVSKHIGEKSFDYSKFSGKSSTWDFYPYNGMKFSATIVCGTNTIVFVGRGLHNKKDILVEFASRIEDLMGVQTVVISCGRKRSGESVFEIHIYDVEKYHENKN